MSKITVKKAISQFTPEQLRGLILDIYSKYKEPKEYLDFFAEPNIEEALDRYRKLAAKEIFRIHHHLPAPRVTVLKGIIKSFSMLEPGFEAETTLRLDVLHDLLVLGANNLKTFRESQFNSICTFMDETCRFLDKNGILEVHIGWIKKHISNTESKQRWYNYFYNILSDTISKWE